MSSALLKPALPAGVTAQVRPYQQRIVGKVVQMFDGTYTDRQGRTHAESESALIESPTGSGKTIIALWVAAILQQRYGFRVGWVAMRRNLLAQAARENIQRGFGLDLRLISMFDKDPPEVDLLIVDEAQHDAALSMARLHSQIRPTKCLGLTATPYRTDRLKLCFRHVIRDAGIQQLIQDGYLARYHHFTIPRYSPVDVAECYASQRARWGKSLMFFFRTEDCFACQRELADAGIAAEVVTGTSHRERQLEDFEADRVDVLISMAVLTEGFDCPALKTVFCRPSGKGCTVQMAGRVFRRHPGLPHKQIVQCRDTRHPFMKTATPDEQYAWMDGGWRTMKLNQELATMTTNTLRVMAACDVRLPEQVANHRPRKRLFHKPPQL